jgi:outer membrane protein TolC
MPNPISLAAWAALSVALSLNTTFAQPPGEWTLEQCLDSAFAASPQLKIRAHQRQAAEFEADEMRAARLGSVGMSGAFSYTSETMSLDIKLPPLPGLTQPSVKFGDGKSYDLALTAALPLYAGGALVSREQGARAGAEAVTSDLSADSVRLAYDVRRAFWAAQGAETRVAIINQSVSRLERHLKDLEEVQKVGMASEEALLQARAALEQAHGSLVTAEGELREARLILGNLVGQAGREVVPAEAMRVAVSMSPETDAWRSRPEISALASRVRQTDKQTSVARGSLLPALSAITAYHYARPGINAVKNDWMDYLVAGVNLSWTAWDFRTRSLRVEKARAAARALEASRMQLENGLLTQQRVAQSRMVAARDALAATKERVRLVEQRYQLVDGAYRKGMRSETELLDAEDDLRTAELELAAAEVRVRLAEADVIFAAGGK